MIKVSVIVPAYNVEDYIERCLNSLVNQTLDEIEIIVVNDGSTDNTKQKIIEFTHKYDGKVIYLEKENGGLSDARNFGIPYAKGEYIGFIDSDDYVEGNMFEEMYAKAKEEDSDLVECDFIWEFPNRKKSDIGRIYKDKKEAMICARVVAWNKIIKKCILEETKIKFPKGLRYEDVEFFYKLLPNLNKISFVKKQFAHYIQRQNSIANTQNERVKEIFDVWDNVFKFYKENGLFDEYKEELEYTYARYLLCSSLLRITKIKDKNIRNNLEKRTWQELTHRFPTWKKNKYFKIKKGMKNIYLKSVNKITFKIYCKILEKMS